MKKFILILLVFLAVFPLSAADKDKEEFPLPAKGSFGIVFNFSNIPIVVAPYSDGVLAGAGLKYLISDKLRLRGLVWAAVDPQGDAAPSTAQIGLSAVCEYHFLPGVISPYIGGLAGIEMDIQEESAYELHFGAVGGAEIRIFKNFSVYAEYGAIFELDEDGMWFNLGNTAMLGVIVYLK